MLHILSERYGTNNIPHLYQLYNLQFSIFFHENLTQSQTRLVFKTGAETYKGIRQDLLLRCAANVIFRVI